MRDRQSSETEPVRPVIDDCWNKIGVRGDGSCPELKQHIHCRNCPVHSAAAAALLDRVLPPDHLSVWTGHFAKERRRDDLGTISVVIFRIGAERLALPTGVFREVAELRMIHPLPHRRDGTMLGLVNVRGELLICVSLGKMLGLDQNAAAEQTKQSVSYRRLLVVAREGRPMAFPVDEVYGLHRCHPAELTAVPATVSKASATYTKAVLSWREKPVGCLDEQLLFQALNRSVA